MNRIGVALFRSSNKHPISALRSVRCFSSMDDDESSEAWITRNQFFLPKKTPMLPGNTFKGKVAFVTGGGTGLGAGMATTLSKLGAKVAIVSRNLDVLKNTADTISAETNNEVLPVKCDVRSAESVRDAVSECIDHLGLPTIVINNAAGNFVSPTLRLSPNAWSAVIDVILRGTINVTMDISKRLISAKQEGTFLNMSANYISSGSSFSVPGACAKSGVESLTKSLASEWCIHGLRFNCIQPGPILTQGSQNQLDPTGRFSKKRLNKIPVGRFGEVEELANLASYIVSDYASWMTGNVIKFDGGEFNFAAGPFNELIEIVEDEEWVVIENLIKNKQKSTSEVVEQS